VKRVLLIDNYDSFTFNLAQAFQILGAEVQVFRNDALTVDEARQLDPTHLVVSPGPGNPDAAGVSLAMLEGFLGVIPLLGVCLGHQSLVQVLGGRIVRAPQLVHGKASPVRHDGRTIYAGLPNPLEVGRYHSLIAEESSIPAVLEVTCRTEDGLVMGVRHREHAAEGVQFHPESVLTPQGDALLGNFLEL
jgi:anthranilate synthase/aminodeoxychorismate synthase-like glutamine amidotransferase